MPESIRKLTLLFGAKTRDAESGIGRVHNAINRLKGLAVGASIAIGVAFGGLSVSAVNAASDLAESINAVNVVFKDGSDTVLDFGKTAANSVGLATAEFNQLATVTGALIKDVGKPMDEVAEITNNLALRAADLASVFNTDVQDAMSAINQAVRGETEAIRRYTGDVTEATLGQFALSSGIQKSVREMTEQEKRLLRVQLIMKQTDFATGDFANTSRGFANTLRRLGAAWTNIRAEMGQYILPILEDVLNNFGDIDKIGNVIVETFRNIVTATINVVKFIASWAKENQAILISFGKILGIVTGLFAAIGILTSPIVAIGIAIVGLIEIWNRWGDDISSVIASAWDVISPFINRVLQGFVFLAKASKAIWDNIVTTIKGAFTSVWDFIKNGFRSPEIKDAAVEQASFLESIMMGVTMAADETFNTNYVDIVGNAFGKASGIAGDALNDLKDKMKSFLFAGQVGGIPIEAPNIPGSDIKDKAKENEVEVTKSNSAIAKSYMDMFSSITKQSQAFFAGEKKQFLDLQLTAVSVGRNMLANTLDLVAKELEAKALLWTAEGIALGWANPAAAGRKFAAAALAGGAAGVVRGISGGIRQVDEGQIARSLDQPRPLTEAEQAAGVTNARSGSLSRSGTISTRQAQTIVISPNTSFSVSNGGMLFIGNGGIEEARDSLSQIIVSEINDAIQGGQIDEGGI